MKKTLIRQDKDNKHYLIRSDEKIFPMMYFHHHLGRYQGDKRNPDWERVTICVYEKSGCDYEIGETIARFQFDGVGCVKQANQKLQELAK
tara:strand:+ start:455 stop:724 length:270 start_codon:yes stop_codon:yes gene_type:complete